MLPTYLKPDTAYIVYYLNGRIYVLHNKIWYRTGVWSKHPSGGKFGLRYVTCEPDKTTNYTDVASPLLQDLLTKYVTDHGDYI